MATPIYKEEDAPLLKEWIIKRLENTTDADADVLADYVLALLNHDVDEAVVRQLCYDELHPFLSDENTSSTFINDVFKTLENKTYLPPSRRPPIQKKPTISGMYDPSKPLEGFTPNQTPFPIPHPATAAAAGAPLNGSRKRSYQDRLDGEGQAPNPFEGQRQYKQARRGGFGAGRGDGVRNGQQRNGMPSLPYPLPGAQMPPVPGPNAPGFAPGPPPPNSAAPQHGQHPLPPNPYANPNPQAVSFTPHFGALGRGPPLTHSGGRGGKQRRKKRCREFDAKGVCSRGPNCPFEHGAPYQAPQPMPPPHLMAAYQQVPQMQQHPQLQQPPHVPPPPGVSPLNDEYDPNEPEFILHAPHEPQHFPYAFNVSRGGFAGPRGGGGRRGRAKGKAPFSADGPVNDPSQTTIVVENIPEERFDEGQVREFFSQFGNVVEITMRPYKRLAIVKYDSWDAAHAAWRSPKVIFDNRFVKVYWYNERADLPPGTVPAKSAGLDYDGVSNGFGVAPEFGEADKEEPEMDMEEFLRKQVEAQKAYEEKKQRREELEVQKRELDKRQQELLKERLDIKQKLEEKLASRKASPDGTVSSEDSVSKSTTDTLRAQLRRLEEEARILGLNPIKEDEPSDSFESPYSSIRGRGGFRGRGYGSRGFGGGYRGRGGGGGGLGGGYTHVHEAYKAYSLDNRPKRVAVSGIDFSEPDKDEMLRQYLLVLGEFSDIQITPKVTHITFKDRKTAETFVAALKGGSVPGLDGTLSIKWVSNGTPPLLSAEQQQKEGEGGGSGGGGQQLKGEPLDKDMPDPSNEQEVGEAYQEQEREREREREREEEKVDMDYDVADDDDWVR